MTQVASNAIQNSQRALGVNARNIANAKSVGSVFEETITKSLGGEGGGATIYTRLNIAEKGAARTTDFKSDLAIGRGTETTGLFVAKGVDGTMFFTHDGSARKYGDVFRLADKSLLMGWMLDKAGNLPQDTSTTSSLVPISLQGVTSRTLPTTKVGLILNLDESQDAILGAGGKMIPAANSIITVDSIESIIIPGANKNGSLHLGDQFRLKAGARLQDAVFEYGGVAVSKKIDSTSPILSNVSDTGKPLTVVDAPTATQLNKGYTLSISIGGGSSFVFTASNTAGQAGERKFSSINDLANAIKLTGEMVATVSGGRLYVTSKDANQSLTFAESNTGAGASLLKALGLDNVPAADADTYRFATIHELQRKMNKDGLGIKSTLNGVGLSYSAKDPLEGLQMGARAQNQRSIYTVTAGYVQAGNHGDNFLKTATISSPNHMLVVGDYVRLSGGPAGLVEGTYKVMFVTSDSFVVGTTAPLAGPGAVGDPIAGVATDGTFKWQKIDGGTSVAAPLITNYGAQVATNVGGTAAFSGLGALPGSLAFNAGDVVYIKGSNSIVEGYYIVTAGALGAGTLSVAVTNAAPGARSDLLIAGHAAAGDAGVQISKVTGTGGGNTLDSYPLETIAGSKVVKVHVTSAANYQVGGVIAFRNLSTDSVLLGGGNISITKDKYYNITAVDAATNTISFEAEIVPAPGGAGEGAVTATFVGFNARCNNAGGARATPGDNTVLGNAAYVDGVTNLYNALGVTITQGQGEAVATAALLNEPLKPAYAPGNKDSNFSGGKVTKGVFTQAVNIVDSLGETHQINIAFGKVDDNQWSVEVYLQKDDNGEYDATIENEVVGGQLAVGKIKFDGNGQLTNVEEQLLNSITVSWKNKATPTPFKINWGALNGLDAAGHPAPAGVTQIDGRGYNNVTAISQDGVEPGNFQDYYFDEFGILYATFDNGENVAVAQLAMATFQNYNALIEKGGNFYASADSGDVILKTAGTGGVAELITHAVTGSAVEDTQEYSDLINNTITSTLNTKVLSELNTNKQKIIDIL